MADTDKIQPASFSETLKLAAFAPTGGKKTLQIGYLIDLVGAENVGIISCERGLNTIRSKVDERFIRNVTSRPEWREAWAWANENFNGPDKWIAVDGGTRVLNWVQGEIFGGAQAALEQIINGTNRRDLSPDVRKYVPFVTKELDLNTQQMWIQTGFQCERLLDSFVKLGSNMYWTFWEERTSIDQYTKGPPAIPDTPGKGALNAVKSIFDFIFRLVPDGANVTAQFRNAPGNNAIYGKTRDDWDGGIKVPDSIAGFRLDEFVKLISGSKGE
jgi:hypothetical protein